MLARILVLRNRTGSAQLVPGTSCSGVPSRCVCGKGNAHFAQQRPNLIISILPGAHSGVASIGVASITRWAFRPCVRDEAPICAPIRSDTTHFCAR